MFPSKSLLSNGLSRLSPMIRKKESLPTRAKDKRGGKPVDTKPKVYVDVSDAPKERGMARVCWFWNKFCVKEGQQKADIDLPWKEGEEPQWYFDLVLPHETIVNPVKQLDPKVVGGRTYNKALRRLSIKEHNAAMVAKDFSIIKKNIKQLPP